MPQPKAPYRKSASALWLLGAAGLSPCVPVLAQMPPDAGTLLQELRPPAAVLPKADKPVLEIQPPPRKSMADPGGLLITLRAVRITGMTVFSEAQLLPLVADAIGKETGLDGLEDLAARISRHYREAGYTIARAYVPAQDIRDGAVELAVIEGRYSAITIKGGSEAARSSLPLGGIAIGDVVADRPLEQTLLLLSDLPGITVHSTLQPGAGIGTSELVIDLEPGKSYSGTVEADNNGGRATGKYRVGGSLVVGNVAGYNDVLTLRALSSGKGLAYGRAAWQFPLSARGAKIGVAASSVRYELGREFEALQAHGTANTLSLYGSYPLYRARGANLNLQANLDEKRLRDDVDSAASSASKRATVLNLGISGDRTDGFGGGGVTSFTVSYSRGRLRLEGPALAADAATAQTNGGYGKANLTVLRLQNINDRTNLYLSASAQWASKNLDSSEKTALGGPGAVRAYPPGETSSDSAQVFTAELRRTLNRQWQLVGFIDAAHGTLNQQRWTAATGPATRSLSGAGAGLNWANDQGWSVRASYAHRLGSSRATAEADHGGRFWLSASKAF
ncbi:MAG: ShlB/FhaC/HecB family hemolysin secretion/activation protein [Ramlibacter sp.]